MAMTGGVAISHEDDDIRDWQYSVRARVTALKCHVMATKGLTPEGQITSPYSPHKLLHLPHNASLLEGADPKVLEEYIASAVSSNIYPSVSPEDVQLRLVDSASTRGSCDSSPSKISTISNISTKPNTQQEENTTTINNKTNSFNATLELSPLKLQSSVSPQNLQSLNGSHETTHSQCPLDDVREELEKLKKTLLTKDSEINRLGNIRDQVENELQELTANLFQEAHSMVGEANQRAATAERGVKEAQMQVEVLTAEVTALKALVITSTPSEPNLHLHRQKNGHSNECSSGKNIFHRGHRKYPSDFDLKYGRDTTPPSSPLKDCRLGGSPSNTPTIDPECWEVDPVVHRQFIQWKESPSLIREDPFIKRIYEEDIDLSLAFPNSTLGHRVTNAVEENSIFIEEVNPRQKSSCPKTCVLLDVPRFCKYRFRLGESDDNWYYISQLARNRIIGVCDFLNYLRYIKLGLVKSSSHDVYWEIVKLRRQMTLARLGF